MGARHIAMYSNNREDCWHTEEVQEDRRTKESKQDLPTHCLGRPSSCGPRNRSPPGPKLAHDKAPPPRPYQDEYKIMAELQPFQPRLTAPSPSPPPCASCPLGTRGGSHSAAAAAAAGGVVGAAGAGAGRSRLAHPLAPSPPSLPLDRC